MRKFMVLAIAALLIVPGAVALAEWEGPHVVTPVYNTYDGSLTNLAKASLSGCYSSYCNEEERVIPINISASIAQWALVSLNATDIEWRVLKPGDYYIDGIHATLQSNGDLYIDYEGFENLVNDEGDTLETYYALAPGAWVTAAALNNDDDLVEESMTHEPVTFTLYNRIEVGSCDSACEYEDPEGATISVILQEQKPWIWDPYVSAQ